MRYLVVILLLIAPEMHRIDSVVNVHTEQISKGVDSLSLKLDKLIIMLETDTIEE